MAFDPSNLCFPDLQNSNTSGGVPCGHTSTCEKVPTSLWSPASYTNHAYISFLARWASGGESAIL